MASLSGVVGLFRGAPQQPVGPGGRMALADHLRELRARLLKIALILAVGTGLALFFYDQLLALIFEPYRSAKQVLGADVNTTATINGVGGPLLLQLKLSAVAAVVGTSPFWLYQLWAFVVPGLRPRERRSTKIFAVVAGPLFLAGVAVGYYVLPKGLQILIGFTPADLQNLVDFGEYFSFVTRMLLVFGVAFEIPLFVVMLSLAGVVSGQALGRQRPWIILGTFVFAAVATPSTDPFSMLMLALPMLALFLLSEVVARLVDRRRRERAGEQLDPDEPSPLDLHPSSTDPDDGAERPHDDRDR